jgi:uncharacterized protein (UPF0261 family)
MDAGVMKDPSISPDIGAADVAGAAGETLSNLRKTGDRGTALSVMARGAANLAKQLHDNEKIHGVLSIGGSCGTAIGTAAMRELPVGFPKVMVSTMASGQVSSYVGLTDITMMHSVVDIAGINRISRRIFINAVGAICGMIEMPEPTADDRPLVAATMFGVTTPCVERVRARLEKAGFEVLVFHATGAGGRAMEGLIDAGFIAGVADVTTTEWCDQLVGGILGAGETRLEAAGRAGIPQVVSCGALDMVNFGSIDTVPERFRSRKLHEHNPNVTLMRTTPEECTALGEIIARKLNDAKGPTTLILPLRGVSAMDKDGEPFHDIDADAALFDAIRRSVHPSVHLIEMNHHINDPEFADAIADHLITSMPGGD